MSEELSAEILEALPTEDRRAEFLKFADLMLLLGDCIIDDNYVIPDAMNSAIHLTSAGESIFNKVVMAKSDRIPPKEARLLCALAIGQEDLFIDLEATDIEALAKSIGEQIVAGKIRFPFTFGRAAYDAYAELFDEGQPILTHAETNRLLSAIPKGVQQYGNYVVGPYGLLWAESSRQLSSGRSIEAFHCSDTMCEAVHETYLTTGEKAPINLHRERFNSALSDDKSKSRGWLGVAAEIRDLPSIVFSDVHVGLVAHLLGDALDDEELKALVVYLFDQTQGELRKSFEEVEVVADATEYVEHLDRSQLLQIALLAKESWLRSALDALVETGTIDIPAGEVRRPVVNSERRSGAFELTAELGSYGVRFTSPASGFAMLRMRHELRSLTSNAKVDEVEELAWQIRHVDGETLEEQLDTFFRETEPAECIERLVLPRKSHVQKLAASLGVGQGLEEPGNRITERFLWKFGYALHDEADPRAEFWRLHQKLRGLVKGSNSSGSRDTEEFLGTSSKFFREFERYLTESLAFTSWALLHDHSQDPNPFQFGLEADHARGMSLVQVAFEESDEHSQTFDFLSEKLSIYTLVRGFGFLSKYLDAMNKNRDDHKRSTEQVPPYARGSRLKRFPFMHTAPFLDLTEKSRIGIIVQLGDVSRSLLRGKVNDIRNGMHHYRKTQDGIAQIMGALDAIDTSMRGLEMSGFGVLEYRVEDTVHDRWGRSEYYFKGPRSNRHVVTRPSAYDWLGMPPLPSPQYVVSKALFAEPNEALRFSRRTDSKYTAMWTNYPNRRRARTSALSHDRGERTGNEVDSDRLS